MSISKAPIWQDAVNRTAALERENRELRAALSRLLRVAILELSIPKDALEQAAHALGQGRA